MDEKGFFFLTSVFGGDLDAFIAEHKEELGALCADSERANSAIIAGVYVEYRPRIVGGFSHVVSISQIG